jgi:hypothetical protein
VGSRGEVAAIAAACWLLAVLHVGVVGGVGERY